MNDFLQGVYHELRRRGFRVEASTFVEIFALVAKFAYDRLWRFDTVALPGVGVIFVDEGRLTFRPGGKLSRLVEGVQHEAEARARELDKSSIVRDERAAAKAAKAADEGTVYKFFS